MYDAIIFGLNPWTVAGAELILLLLTTEFCFRFGLRQARKLPVDRSQMVTIEESVVVIFGLLLGFTFSISQSRFDARRQLVVQEANSIETTYLRAQLLPPPYRGEASRLLREYAAVRVPKAGTAEVEQSVTRSGQLHDELWQVATNVAQNLDKPALVLLFTNSLNETIDLHTMRIAAYLYRAPAGLLFLLLVGAALAMGAAGFANGLDNTRNAMVMGALAVLLAAVLGLIVDLEQSSRGMFVTSQQPLLDVQEHIAAVESKKNSNTLAKNASPGR